VHSISFEVPDQLIPVFPALVDEDLTCGRFVCET
jgi:hypothetical protein